MKTTEKGFSIVEALVVFVIIGFIIGIGYVTLQRNENKTSKSSTAKTVSTDGTAQSSDDIATQDMEQESAIDSTYTDADASNAQATNTAANNIGDAYDETHL